MATAPTRCVTRSARKRPTVIAVANEPYANAAVPAGAPRIVLRCSTLQSFATPSHSINRNANPAMAHTRVGVLRRGAVTTDSALGCGRRSAGIATTVSTRPNTATPESVADGLQPQLSVRAPTSAATTPPIDHMAWKADMIDRPY